MVISLDVSRDTNEFYPGANLETISTYRLPNAGRPLDQILAAQSPERRILVVDLKKQPKVGVGLQIVGGENTRKLDLGLFIKVPFVLRILTISK